MRKLKVDVDMSAIFEDLEVEVSQGEDETIEEAIARSIKQKFADNPPKIEAGAIYVNQDSIGVFQHAEI